MGKNEKKASPVRRKAGMLAAAIAVLVIASVGAKGVFAWLKDSTGEITNTFTPSEVTCEVEETFENNIKSNVSIKNTGDIDAYIRAALVFTWVDPSTNNIIAGTPEEGTDYTIDINSTGEWVRGDDGFYYCQETIAPGDKTPVLIKECKVNTPSQDRYIQLEIIASAIQAKPFKSPSDAWNATKELPKEGQNNE